MKMAKCAQYSTVQYSTARTMHVLAAPYISRVGWLVGAKSGSEGPRSQRHPLENYCYSAPCMCPETRWALHSTYKERFPRVIYSLFIERADLHQLEDQQLTPLDGGGSQLERRVSPRTTANTEPLCDASVLLGRQI